MSIDYHLQSTDDLTNYLGHNDSNDFTPLIASRRTSQRIVWKYVYYDGSGGVFYTFSPGNRTFWHFNNLRINGNVGLVTGDSSLAQDPSNIFIIVNATTPRYIQHQQWYVQFDPSTSQPTLPATSSDTAPNIGFNVTPA